MTTVLGVLERAKKRVTQGWIQFFLAKTKNNLPVVGCHPDAIKWCALGALEGSTKDGDLWDWGSEASAAQSFIEDHVLHRNLVTWNNDPKRTQEEVVDLFDRAIKMWKLEEVST